MTEDRNRQSLPVENVLVWAYAEQMVHQARQVPVEMGVRGGAPLAAFSSLWEEGGPVEGSRNQGFDASPDAWRIHEAVLTLGSTTVDCGQDLAAARYHALGQFRGAEPPIGNAGTADATMRGPATPRPWPTDGLLKIDVRTLVQMHASKATRPVMSGKAKQKLRFSPGQTVWHPKRKTKVYAKGWYSHVTVEGDMPGEIARDRALYQAWWGALASVQRQLQAVRLTMFAITDTLPPPLKNVRRGLAG